VGNSWNVGGDAGAYVGQWAPQKIRLAVAHQINRGKDANGRAMRIAVLDTGVDSTHPALVGHLLPGFDFVDNDNDPSEVGNQQTGPYGHGTHVAGLIALVAPEAKIIPIRVLDKNGLGNVWVLSEALAYAVDPDNNPNTDDGADVINLSLSTLRQTRLLRSVLSRICDDVPLPGEDNFPAVANPNLVVVAAAGNGADTTRQYPAAENVAGMIAVGASNSADALATFSTRGSWIARGSSRRSHLEQRSGWAVWNLEWNIDGGAFRCGRGSLSSSHLPGFVRKESCLAHPKDRDTNSGTDRRPYRRRVGTHHNA